MLVYLFVFVKFRSGLFTSPQTSLLSQDVPNLVFLCFAWMQATIRIAILYYVYLDHQSESGLFVYPKI